MKPEYFICAQYKKNRKKKKEDCITVTEAISSNNINR